jgi:hypothetical protein
MTRVNDTVMLSSKEQTAQLRAFKTGAPRINNQTADIFLHRVGSDMTPIFDSVVVNRRSPYRRYAVFSAIFFRKSGVSA